MRLCIREHKIILSLTLELLIMKNDLPMVQMMPDIRWALGLESMSSLHIDSRCVAA